jgi:hypothetical protein
MAIEAITDDKGFTWLQGVYVGQGQEPKDRVFLGLNSFYVKHSDNSQGTFHIGLDNRIQPAVARVFYEPPPFWVPPGTSTIGLIQFCQYSFQGKPLPPERYSSEIDYKNAYYIEALKSTDKFWLDIMSPQNACELLQTKDIQLMPFYAFNSMLFDKNLRWQDFYAHGNPHGSLLKYSQELQANDSLAASLIAPVGLDIDVLDETAVTKEIDRYRSKDQNPIFSEPYAPNELDEIQYVLALMNRKKETLEKGQSNQTSDIVESDILWVKVIGQYLMIQFDDPERVGGLICVFKSQDGTTITAYNFDTYTFESLMLQANTHMFEKYIEYQKMENAFYHYIGAQTGMSGRGRSSLEKSPFLSLPPSDIAISFKHLILSYAVTNTSIKTLGGVQLEIIRKFNFADSQWRAPEFKYPLSHCVPAANSPYDLKKYFSIFNPKTRPNINEPKCPTTWFSNLKVVAAGRKVGFGAPSTNWI